MSNSHKKQYTENMLVYWFDLWTLESGIGLTINSIEFYAKPNKANNMRTGSWIEVLTESESSFVIVEMPPCYIFEIDEYSSYESFRSIMSEENKRGWII